MSDTPSFGDLLVEFSKDAFVGRQEQLELFEKALTATRPPFLILDVSGQGGVGKTTLLERFHRIAREHNALSVLTNEDHVGVPAVLATFARQLAEAGHPCKTFDERYRKYRELKEQVEADPGAPKGMLDFALRSATRIGLRAVKKYVPLAQEAADVLLTPDAEDRFVEETGAMAGYIARKFTNKDERVLLLETDAELTRHFLTDLNHHAESRKAALLFDSYEKTAPMLESWLLDLLGGKFGPLSGNARLVIAGRYPLGQPWLRYRQATRQVELQPFTEAEARDYLARSGITEEKQVQTMLTLSRRLPVLLALLVSAPGETPGEVAGDAVERFLQGATPEQREWALAGSVSRFFNQDILAVLLGPEAAKPAFEWLSEAHFVRAGERGWAYHEVVRTLMLKYLRARSAQQCEGLHSQMAAHFQRQGEALGLAEEKRRRDAQWHDLNALRLYHMWGFNPAEALPQTLMGFLEAHDIDEVTHRVSYAQMLRQAGEELGRTEVREWAERLSHLTELPNTDTPATQRQQALAALKAVCEFDRLPVWHQAQARRLLGRAYYRLKDYPAALADFSRAVELQPDNGYNYQWRGSTHYELKDYAAALADFSRAIELQPDNGYNYRWRGLTHYELKDYAAALAD
ncbi:MAG: tetratricopeptide repeat protein, partial [Anaerolineales bacterium]|nr:tetratricopeptide repeat protein [Anaerolineales bacterium]